MLRRNSHVVSYLKRATLNSNHISKHRNLIQHSYLLSFFCSIFLTAVQSFRICPTIKPVSS